MGKPAGMEARRDERRDARPGPARIRPVVWFAVGSIGVAFIALALKFSAARVSGSAALFSDALEALINVGASGLALFALIVSAKPPDLEHPYGHAKVELLSAVCTGAMILAAAILILKRALFALWHPPALAPLNGALGLGLCLNGAAGAFNLLWALILRRIGRNSPALKADAGHLMADVLTTVGIVLALVAAARLRLPVLDPLVAIAIAAQVAIVGAATLRRSFSGLLDEAPAPEMTARIQDLVRLHAKGALQAHDLRVRQAGPACFLEFHLVVPGEMTVAAAHDICDRIEAALRAEMEGVAITIHVEPEVKAKQEGALVP